MKDKKLNVLLVIPNLGSGGAQRVFHQQRQFLSEHFNVTACVFNFNGAFPDEKNENILSLDVPAGGSLIGKIFYFLQRVRRLKKIKRDYNIDVSISHLEGADYVNILSKQKDRLGLWIHGTKLHDKEIHGVIGWLRRNVMLPWLYRRANKIICVSQGIEAEMKLMVPLVAQKIMTIRNGIDIQTVQRKSKEPLQPEWQSVMSNHFVIVTHCRFAQQKNLRALIHVIAKLDDINVKFVLIGDGEQYNELIALAKKLKIALNEKLFFAGQQKNPFPWLRHSSLYILTSLWEGFPLSLCEAIICGLPVMAADCPTGPREILSAVPAGVLMPLVREDSPSSIDIWADKLRSLIHDRDQLQSWRKTAIENAGVFSDQRLMNEVITIIKNKLA